MDMNNIDSSAYWNQAVQCWSQLTHNCDQVTHWMMNDGSSFTAFLVFVSICCAVVACVARGQKKQLTELRAGYSRERFVQEMTDAGYDPEVVETVYQYIEDMHRIDFPILPGDDLYTVLGITDDGVRRAMPTLLRAMGREAQIGRLMKPLTTVEDLVKFVAAAPRSAEYVWELQPA